MPSAIATSPDGSVIPVSVGGMATDLGQRKRGGAKREPAMSGLPHFRQTPGPSLTLCYSLQ